MKKFLMRIACVCLAIVSAVSLCSCGGDKEEGENGYLKISAVGLGYGVEWLNEMVKEFEKSSGINVEIVVKEGSAGQGQLDEEIKSLKSDTDLFFNKRGFFAKSVYDGSISTGGQSYDCLYADLSDVWNSVVDEGSGKTIKDKIYDNYASVFEIDGKYYALPWAGGVYGITRNLSVWNELNLTDADVPYTTDELFALCDKVVASNVDASPFIYALEGQYYGAWTTIFFAQYEGKEKAEQLKKGLDPDGELSQYLYTYTGQEEALKVLEKLITTSGYQCEDNSSSFSLQQEFFIDGDALFMINGSWLETEASNFDNSPIDMIKTPVISSLANRLSFRGDAEADKKLSDIIKYVDKIDAGEAAEKPSYATDDDIKIVTEARHYSYMAGGTDHQAYVPSYSSHIREAKEFLKFMYSDKGLNIYYKTLNGATLPATPVGEYEAGVTLSDFRKCVNAATEEDFTFDREVKSRMFMLNQLNICFSNGFGTEYKNLVDAILKGKSAADIMRINQEYIEKNWQSFRQQLGV